MMTETAVTVTTVEAPQPAVKTDPGQGGALSWLRINTDYFRSLPGIIKIIQLILGIICMSCSSPAYRPGTHWFLFVATVSFIASLIWVVVYLLSIREALKLPINWILTELINTGILTVLYFTAFVTQLNDWSGISSNVTGRNLAAGVFGIFNTIAYAAGVYFLFVEWKNSRGAN